MHLIRKEWCSNGIESTPKFYESHNIPKNPKATNNVSKSTDLKTTTNPWKHDMIPDKKRHGLLLLHEMPRIF